MLSQAVRAECRALVSVEWCRAGMLGSCGLLFLNLRRVAPCSDVCPDVCEAVHRVYAACGHLEYVTGFGCLGVRSQRSVADH